jgi:hypothetical protein
VIDFNDSVQLMEIANKNIELSEKYQEIRRKYADSKIAVDSMLAVAYSDAQIDKKYSYDKALLLLLADQKTEEFQTYYNDLIKSEHEYKALEKVLTANSEKLILCQSLIKNQKRNE